MKPEILDLPRGAGDLQRYISKRLSFKVCFAFFRLWPDTGEGWVYHLSLIHEPTGKVIWVERVSITSSHTKMLPSPREVGKNMFEEMKENMIVYAVGNTLSELPNFKEEMKALRERDKGEDG